MGHLPFVFDRTWVASPVTAHYFSSFPLFQFSTWQERCHRKPAEDRESRPRSGGQVRGAAGFFPCGNRVAHSCSDDFISGDGIAFAARPCQRRNDDATPWTI